MVILCGYIMWLYCVVVGAGLPAVTAAQAAYPMEEPVRGRRPQGARPARQDAHLQPHQAYHGGGGPGAPLPGAVLRPRGRGRSKTRVDEGGNSYMVWWSWIGQTC